MRLRHLHQHMIESCFPYLLPGLICSAIEFKQFDTTVAITATSRLTLRAESRRTSSLDGIVPMSVQAPGGITWLQLYVRRRSISSQCTRP